LGRKLERDAPEAHARWVRCGCRDLLVGAPPCAPPPHAVPAAKTVQLIRTLTIIQESLGLPLEIDQSRAASVQMSRSTTTYSGLPDQRANQAAGLPRKAAGSEDGDGAGSSGPGGGAEEADGAACFGTPGGVRFSVSQGFREYRKWADIARELTELLKRRGRIELDSGGPGGGLVLEPGGAYAVHAWFRYVVPQRCAIASSAGQRLRGGREPAVWTVQA
jgi:hypothetical protein